MALHKHKMLEAWRHKWSNSPNSLSAWFQPANKLPPTLKLMKRFLSTDRKTFSRLMQAHTGHAHTGKYYKRFVPTQEIGCPCGTNLQTRQHITLECKAYSRHRNVLRTGHTEWGRLTGTIKGINKLISFLKNSDAFNKTTPAQDPTAHERRPRGNETRWRRTPHRESRR